MAGALRTVHAVRLILSGRIRTKSRRLVHVRIHTRAEGRFAVQPSQLLVRSIRLRDLYRDARGQTNSSRSRGLHALFDKHDGEQLRLVEAALDRLRRFGRAVPWLTRHPLRSTSASDTLDGTTPPILLLLELLDVHDTVLATTCTGATSDGCPYTAGAHDFATAQVLLINKLQSQVIHEQVIARLNRRRAAAQQALSDQNRSIPDILGQAIFRSVTQHLDKGDVHDFTAGHCGYPFQHSCCRTRSPRSASLTRLGR
jgi:starvation-inducible DNA-binding protein